MLVVKEIDKNQVHTFRMPKVEKNAEGRWIPVVKDDKPVMESQTFFETGAVENGLPVVARALTKNKTHVLLYVKDKEKEETR